MEYINEYFDQSKLDSLSESYHSNGFVKIQSIFSESFIKYVKNRIDESINAPVDKYQTGFNRIAFDLFVDDKKILSLMKDDLFRNIMSKISTEKLFFTQALAFELEKNKSTGFPWHIGTQSFGYQYADDYGCTLWMPLEAIDAQDQRGGMAYVPENILSGKFMYENVDPAIASHIQELNDNGNNPELEHYLGLRDGVLNEPSFKTLLDHFAVEDDFQIGDVLLFNKNVIHRSVKLEEGVLDRRGAFVMRFVNSESTYDKKRAMSLDYPRKLFNYSGCTTFHLDVCENDGDVISKSNYFSDHDVRFLKP